MNDIIAIIVSVVIFFWVGVMFVWWIHLCKLFNHARRLQTQVKLSQSELLKKIESEPDPEWRAIWERALVDKEFAKIVCDVIFDVARHSTMDIESVDLVINKDK